ncbi:MAG: nucleotide-binding protein [Planctomycetes bacterium]|nr:nucleotide-binding protein [Planctomycetota bacterium]
MSHSHTSPFETQIEQGEALRRMVGGLTARLGRRADDLDRPEIVATSELWKRLAEWDRANVERIRVAFPERADLVARYVGGDRLDRQLFITDFGSHRQRIMSGVVDKLALLRALEDELLRPSPVDASGASTLRPHRVFLGHGRDLAWLLVKDFVHERLGLAVDEFDREPVAGSTVAQRLETMLERCTLGVLVMTAEDEHSDGSWHARENVVHEIGLAQGRFGGERTIVLLEAGCETFSNLDGRLQLRFPRGSIGAVFEPLRRVFEREGLLRNPAA